MEENKIVIYQTDDGQTQIDVRLENETVWLSQAQMAELFQTDRTSILRHINNIYRVDELDRESTCAKIAQVQTEGKRQVRRTIPYYNLDMIISVGYRVNSKRGIRFRQWANNILKQYLIKGYAISERIRHEQVGELRQLVGMLGRTIQSQPLLTTNESQALFDVVTDYTYALDTLDNYDYQRLTIEKTTQKERFHATYENAMNEISALATSLETVVCLATRKMTHSRAVSAKSIKPSVARNYIQVLKRKQRCFCTLSLRIIPLVMVTRELPLHFSFGFLTTMVFFIAMMVASELPTILLWH